MKAKIKPRIDLENRTKLETVIPLNVPFVIFVDPSDLCNFHCKFCPTGDIKLMKKVGRSLKPMDFNLYKKIIDDICEFEKPIKVLRLYKDGEPLLNPRFADMVRYAKEKKCAERIDTTTNASLLNPKINLEIIEAGLDRINISIEGINANQYLGFSNYKIDFDKLVGNIRHLYENRKNCEIIIKINGDTISDDDKKILEMFPSYNFNFEGEILPLLISKKQLSGYRTDHRYYSISTPERVKMTENFLLPKKVIFLDRDGVINKKPPKADYVKKWEEFEFLPGAIEALKILNQNNYEIYFISNQPGIARGMMTKEDLENIQKKLEEVLEKNNVKIAGAYYCPHGWEDGCECRKPKPGLLFQAARDHNLDLSKVVFIGDDERDIQAGEAAGCKTILIEPGGNLFQVVKNLIQRS